MKYIVFSSYYKHGEVNARVYNASGLRTEAINVIKQESTLDRIRCGFPQDLEFVEDAVSRMSHGSLIEKMVELGKIVIESQGGWGWRYVYATQGELQRWKASESY